MRAALLDKINNKTKPPGALGTLEAIALQIGIIQKTLTPSIQKPHIVVFASDHGIALNGKVNPYPQSVTAQMVQNFVSGGAAINVFCKQNQIELSVADAGVNFTFNPALPIIHAKAAMGTNDYTNQPAMCMEQADFCLQKGAAIVEDIYAGGCNTIGFGEMGIGNTSAAALIMHHYTKYSVADCTGTGTGSNAEQLKKKIETLTNCSRFHQLDKEDLMAKELLCKIGGFEIAMMAGAYCKATELDMVILVDGFIATAALLVSLQLQKEEKNATDLLENCIFAHTSSEKGHQLLLQYLGATPLLQLGMRLGEGTGAAVAMPLLQNACAFLNEMASFESAGVDNKIIVEE